MDQTSKLTIKVDTAAATKQVSEFGKLLGATDAAAEGFAKRMQTATSTAFFEGATKGAYGAETELAKLNASLKYTGRVLNDFTEQLKKVKSQFADLSNQATISSGDAASGISKTAKAATKLADAMGALNAVGDPTSKVGKISTAIKTLADASNLISATPTSATGISKIATAMTKLADASAKLSQHPESLKNVKGISDKMQAAGTAMGTARDASAGLATNLDKINTQFTNAATNVDKAKSSMTRFHQEATKAAEALIKVNERISNVNQNMRNLASRTTDTSNRFNGLAANSRESVNRLNELDTTLRRLANVMDRHNRSAAAAAAAQGRLGTGAAAASSSVNLLTLSMSRLQGLLLGGVWTMAAFSVAKTADAMQNLDSQVKIVTNSHEEFLDVRERIRDIADKNFNDIEATTNLYQKSARALSNLGKSQSDALEFTDAIALAMRTGGRSAQEQASAILQLGQAMGAGVVMGDEFRSISENAPVLLELVAKELGVLPGQLKELSKEGVITSEVMFNAVTKHKSLLEDMAKKMPLTMTQAFNLVRNQYKTAVGDFMNQTGGASSVIANMLKTMALNFKEMANTGILVATVALVGFAAKVNVAAVAMRVLNAVVKANPFVLLVSTILAVGTALYGVNDVMDTSTILVGDLLSYIATGYQGLADLISAIHYDITSATVEGNEANNASYQGYFSNTEKGFLGMAQGIMRTVAAATATVAGFATWFGNAFWQMAKVGVNALLWVGNKVNELIVFISKKVNAFQNQFIENLNTLGRVANNFLERTPFKFRFEGTGTIAYDGPEFTPVPYLEIKGGTLQQNISTSLDFLQTSVDNYIGGVAQELEVRGKKRIAGEISNQAMSAEKALQYQQLQLAKAREAEKEALKKAGKGKTKTKSEKTPWAVDQRVLDQAVKYDYAALEKREGLPAGLLAALSNQESKGVYNAIGPETKWGTAKGAFQIIDATADTWKMKRSDRFNVGISADFAAKELGRLTRKFGSVDLAIAGYNAGPDSVKKGKDGQYRAPNYKETNKYVKNINHYMEWMNGGLDGSVNYNSIIAERVKEVEAAQKVVDDLRKEQERVGKEIERDYQTTPAKIVDDLRIELERLESTPMSAELFEERVTKATDDAHFAYEIYKKGLADQLDDLKDHQRTESEMIIKHRDNLKFEKSVDPELRLRSNADLLQKVLDEIDLAAEKAMELHETELQKKISDLYTFKKTELQILKATQDDEIAEAKLMTDEISEVRIEAITERHTYEREMLKLTQEMNLLELNKAHMTSLEYIKKEAELSRRLNNMSFEDDEVKTAKNKNIDNSALDAMAEVQERVGGGYKAQGDRLRGGFQIDQTPISDALKADLALAKEAMDEGLITEAEYLERSAALKEESERASRELTITAYEDQVKSVSESFKIMFGEQSKAYRIMFAVEKAFSIARSVMAIQTGIAQALALPFPANIGAATAVAAAAANIVSSIQAVRSPGIAGQAHDGLANVPREGTYILDAGERVVKPRDNQKLTKFLDNESQSAKTNEAAGVKVIVNNFTSAEVTTTTNQDGNLELKIVDVMNRQLPAQLANPSSPISKGLASGWQVAPRR